MVDLLYDPGLTSHQQLVSRVLGRAAGTRTSRQYRAVILCHDTEQAPTIPTMMACHFIALTTCLDCYFHEDDRGCKETFCCL